MDPIAGGPADKAGIESGDVLLEVNGNKVVGEDLKKATDMMKRKNKGSFKFKTRKRRQGNF